MNLQHRTRIVALATCVASLAVLAAGCSSSPKTHAANQVSASSAPGSAASPVSASKVDLSGNWTGSYGGSFSGTFQLSWKQTGSTVSGTITLSAPASTLNLTGTVTGGTIKFGTVGSDAISYTGDVSATSMAGKYQVAGKDAGTWTAKKS